MRLNLEQHPGARFLLVAAALVVVIFGIRSAASILVPFLLALFLAVLNLPLLATLRRWRVPLPLAVFFAVLTNGAVFAFLVLVVGRSLEEFVTAVPRYTVTLQAMAESGLESLASRGLPVSDLAITEIFNASSIIDWIGGALRGLGTLLATAFLVLIIMIFVLLEAAAFPEKLRRALGADTDVGRWSKITREIQRYLGIKTLVSMVTGILAGLWCSMLGIDFPLLWGLVAFLLNYIPSIGSVIAAIPPLLLGLVLFGPSRAVAVVLGYLAINVSLGNVVEPSLMGRKLGLSALVVVLSLLFWGWVLGPVGMLLAVPLTMAVKIMLENTRDFHWLAIVIGGSALEPTAAVPAGAVAKTPAASPAHAGAAGTERSA
jgi:AI-2 transport protein TqsA